MTRLPRAKSRAEVRRFYRTAEWRGLRAVALHVYGRRCRFCGSETGPFDVDHIAPVRTFWAGRLQLANLQVLCQPCHRGIKRREERAW